MALFTGCVGDVLFRQTNWATARVLQQNGCDVHGAAKSGLLRGDSFSRRQQRAGPRDGRSERRRVRSGRASMRSSSTSPAAARCSRTTAIIGTTNAKRAANDSPPKSAIATSSSIELGLIPPAGEIRLTATYHDACHLAHAQKVREQPRNLLKKIPGLKLVELPESELCCGAAGTYNLTEPEMAERLARRKLANILSTGARLVITANAGCLLQIAREARMQGEELKIMHPMELLDLSYRRENVRF